MSNFSGLLNLLFTYNLLKVEKIFDPSAILSSIFIASLFMEYHDQVFGLIPRQNSQNKNIETASKSA